MFWPRSHLERHRYDAYHAAVTRSGSLDEDRPAMAEMVVPACPAGGLVLVDFRLLHRGMPNDTGRDRALAHAIVSTGLARDQLNSRSSPSLRAALAAMPSDPAYHDAWKELQQQQQLEAWRVTRESSAR